MWEQDDSFDDMLMLSVCRTEFFKRSSVLQSNWVIYVAPHLWMHSNASFMSICFIKIFDQMEYACNSSDVHTLTH